jgi:enamine deaminase RidA (YjgF/YER057c/UK114 family)
MDIYKKLKELSLELPKSSKALAMYVPVKIVGNMAYVSGQVPIKDGKLTCTGKVGGTVTIEQAQEAAKQIGLNTFAALHEYVGDLNKIKSAVKVTGFVASADGFNEQPTVINAFSQMLVDVLGERGVHTRSAVGTNELPLDVAVEIESIFEIEG